MEKIKFPDVAIDFYKFFFYFHSTYEIFVKK